MPYQARESISMLPVAGTAMATLAGLLHEAGHRVDSQLYPDVDAVLTAFRAGTAQVPSHGLLRELADDS